jgi:malate dehydrogenase
MVAIEMKISLLGGGSCIAPVASTICHLNLFSEVVWVDDKPVPLQDTLQDLKQAVAIGGADTELRVTHDWSALADSQIVILLPHASSPIQARRRANFSRVQHAARQIRQHAPKARVVVATPSACSLAFCVYRELAAEANQVIGLSGGIGCAYLKMQIAHQLSVSAEDVAVLAVGNDEVIYPLPQYCRVNGIPLTELLDVGQIDALTQAVQDTHKKSSTIDAPYTLATWISQIVTAIVLDKKRIMCVSSLIQSSAARVYLNVPTQIGREGAESILQFDLTDVQREQFTQLVAGSVKEQRTF